MHVLGIDAGERRLSPSSPTRTAGILGEGRAGAANLQTEGELEVEKTLHTAIDNAANGQDLTVGRGLPRYGRRGSTG
jgi:N-acetylglucosamine kinase-like BadF-type ATPase